MSQYPSGNSDFGRSFPRAGREALAGREASSRTRGHTQGGLMGAALSLLLCFLDRLQGTETCHRHRRLLIHL